MSGVVYFIQSGDCGPVKVGFSTVLGLRVEALQCSSPYPIYVRGTIDGPRKLEKSIHRWLSIRRVRGEWYEAEHALAVLKWLDGKPAEQSLSEVHAAIADRSEERRARRLVTRKMAQDAVINMVERHGFECVRGNLGYTKHGLTKVLKRQSMPKTEAMVALFELDETSWDAIFASRGKRLVEITNSHRGLTVVGA
jgi:hypothetical protein